MARSKFFRSPIETTRRRSSTAQKLVRERFWIFADSIILVLFDVVGQNEPISSLTSFYIHEILLPWPKEKKRKKATSELFA
jgi:hypothetical protein